MSDELRELLGEAGRWMSHQGMCRWAEEALRLERAIAAEERAAAMERRDAAEAERDALRSLNDRLVEGDEVAEAYRDAYWGDFPLVRDAQAARILAEAERDQWKGRWETAQATIDEVGAGRLVAEAQVRTLREALTELRPMVMRGISTHDRIERALTILDAALGEER